MQPKRAVYSETFIRNHIENLPGNVFDLYGDWYPAFDANDQRIADRYIRRNWQAKAIAFACKLLPAFIANRVPSPVKGYPYDDVFDKAAFRYFLQSKKIDVVLAEFMLKGVVVKDVCAELGIPFVVHTHGGGDFLNDHSLARYSDLYADMFRKASRVISVDSYSTEKLLALGLKKEKLVQLNNGINLKLFKPTTPSANEAAFFAVGRFTDKKAPHLTILAFAEAVKKYSTAKLTLAGTGVLLESCKQLVKTLGLEKNVFLPGIMTPLQVAESMQRSRAFVQHSVHTSYGDSEGTPVAILEAMACGLPIVSTLHNGITDTVTHGEDGLLVAENDTYTMANCIGVLIEDPGLADRLGQKARKKAESAFELSKVIGELYSLLEEAATISRT